MFATGTHICSVASFTRYVFNLHKECDVLWQRPNYLFDEDGEWCEKKTLDKNVSYSLSFPAPFDRNNASRCLVALTANWYYINVKFLHITLFDALLCRICPLPSFRSFPDKRRILQQKQLMNHSLINGFPLTTKCLIS
jgi:hypothetical protein